MTSAAPYYERELSSFDDEIITRQRRSRDGAWRAVLDCGFNTWVSDPDFSTSGYGATREQAARGCAFAIRQDAKGIGKFAPHDLLTPGYDLKFRLMRHWNAKERFRELGVDPNETMREVADADHDWKLNGDWLRTTKASRHLEFNIRLLLAEAEQSIANGADPMDARDHILKELRDHTIGYYFLSASPSAQTWELLSNRIDSMVADAVSKPSPAVP